MSEERRRPSGNDGYEVLANRIKELEQQLHDLETTLAQRTTIYKRPVEFHKHIDARQALELTGDSSFTIPLMIYADGATSFDESAFRGDTEIGIYGGDPQIEFVDSTQAAGTAGRRFWIRKGAHLYFLIDDNDSGGWNTPHPMLIEGDTGDVVIGRLLKAEDEIRPSNPSYGGYGRIYQIGGDRIIWRVYDSGGGNSWFDLRRDLASPRLRVWNANVLISEDLDVTGSKNALIPDPNDETIGYHFAAVEADEPGLLMHRNTVTIPSGETSATLDLPEHWARIATNADAMVTPIAGEGTEQKDQRVMPHATVDITLPRVTVEGLPGDYRIWILAQRADNMVSDWQHVVDIPPDENEV